MALPHTLRVAAAQYPVERLTSVELLKDKLARWVAEAAGDGARLLVFPEFAGVEFASLQDRRVAPDRRSPERHQLGSLLQTPATRRVGPSLQWETAALQSTLHNFLEVHAELAVSHKVYMLAGSVPVKEGADLRNRAYFFAPDGTVTFQDKIVPTRWEREVWGVNAGADIRVIETDFGPIGIAICYDIEFPLVARLQAEAGARIVLAPCCCDSLRGYHRVRVGARARALENQAYVLQAPVIGQAPWSGTLGASVGSAGIYGPPDLGLNPNGVIAQGRCDTPQWVFADLDLKALDRIRSGGGAVANEDEWRSHLKFHHASKATFQSVSVALDKPV
jgi:predicted amidohydrolase